MGILSNFVIVWLVTSVSLYVLSRLPTGIESQGFGPSLVTGLVLGLLNATLRPLLGFFAFPITFITFGLFSFVLNGIVFLIAATFVKGFGLRHGCLTALIGSILLSLLNALDFRHHSNGIGNYFA